MIDIKVYAKKVNDMRTAQANFFEAKKQKLSTVADSWLTKSKALEKEVDTLTAGILAPTVQGKML